MYPLLRLSARLYLLTVCLAINVASSAFPAPRALIWRLVCGVYGSFQAGAGVSNVLLYVVIGVVGLLCVTMFYLVCVVRKLAARSSLPSHVEVEDGYVPLARSASLN